MRRGSDKRTYYSAFSDAPSLLNSFEVEDFVEKLYPGNWRDISFSLTLSLFDPLPGHAAVRPRNAQDTELMTIGSCWWITKFCVEDMAAFSNTVGID